MERSGYGVAKDVQKHTTEDGKFPIICESCLGDNPYVRMVREPAGKECKICNRPYNSFRWKPGPKARFKQTIICQLCARLKNVCQTCLFDLEYGLPVQVRDKFLEAHQKLELPDSHVNRNYLASQMDKMVEDLPYGKSLQAHESLRKLTRSQPYYKRNRPRVCTFWLRGACNRGEECPFLHEDDEHDPQLADQNIRDRFVGQDDPVANKILRRATQAATSQENKQPEDKSITTLYVRGVTSSINEKLLRDSFATYGEIWSIKMVPRQSCAFVTFASRRSAEEAMEALFQNFRIKGETLHVTWGRPNTNSIDTSKADGFGMLMREQEHGGAIGEGYIAAAATGGGMPSHGYAINSGSTAMLGQPSPGAWSLISSAPVQGLSDSRRVMYASMNPAEAEHRK